MPTPGEILSGLARVSNEARWVAVGWHLIAGFSIMLVFAGLRLQRRTAALLLSLPLLSVSVVAIVFANPVQAAVFALLAPGLAALALRAPPGLVALGPRWAVALGSFLIAFGWAYPQFVAARSTLTYLYAAPLGVIASPTLAFVVGVALVSRGFALGAWCLALGVVACVVGLVGAVRLGITIDLALLAGGIGLITLGFRKRLPTANPVRS